MSEDLTGTKELIFDIALEMFAACGYERVTMRSIAKRAEIKAASIYYHFSSKEEILDFIYQYFSDYFFDNVKSTAQIKDLFDKGNYLDLINASALTFYGLPPNTHKRMALILKIIYMRLMLRDEKANKIFLDLIIGENWQRAKTYLEYGVSIGRINPDLGIKALFEIVLYVRLMTGIVELAENNGKTAEQKDYLNELLAKLLDKYHQEG